MIQKAQDRIDAARYHAGAHTHALIACRDSVNVRCLSCPAKKAKPTVHKKRY